MPRVKKPRVCCLVCGKTTARSGYKYCSNTCQFEYQFLAYIDRWRSGKESGLRNIGVVCNHVKRYLRRKFNNKCCLCGWAEVNLITGQVPLIADHVDGNWRNNTEENLRLICPNCDSLTPTYAALNKGNGRIRVLSRRASEAKLLLKAKKPK